MATKFRSMTDQQEVPARRGKTPTDRHDSAQTVPWDIQLSLAVARFGCVLAADSATVLELIECEGLEWLAAILFPEKLLVHKCIRRSCINEIEDA